MKKYAERRRARYQHIYGEADEGEKLFKCNAKDSKRL